MRLLLFFEILMEYHGLEQQLAAGVHIYLVAATTAAVGVELRTSLGVLWCPCVVLTAVCSGV